MHEFFYSFVFIDWATFTTHEKNPDDFQIKFIIMNIILYKR